MSAPRRATILILRVGFFLVGAGALIAVLYVLLRAALEGDASRLSDDLTVSVPLVVVSGLMVWHLTEQRTKTAPGTPDQPVPVAGSGQGRYRHRRGDGSRTPPDDDPGNEIPQARRWDRHCRSAGSRRDRVGPGIGHDLGRNRHGQRRGPYDRPGQLRCIVLRRLVIATST